MGIVCKPFNIYNITGHNALNRQEIVSIIG